MLLDLIHSVHSVQLFATESCRHHPGVPFFHDAYKGWTCCNKKSVDFTEFLNIKGCELSKHSNIKPIEPEKPPQTIDEDDLPKEIVNKPVKPSQLTRPSFNAELIRLKPTVAPALQQAIDKLVVTDNAAERNTSSKATEIAAGTTCKNGGCGATYQLDACNDTDCVHHPGVPIFHEGLKFWSCCTKRTTDFTAFMNQKGCAYGQHKWTNDSDDQKEVQCRYDWHQTGSNVVIAIYAKLYHYENSFVKVNPVRLNVSLVFPQQNNAEFNLDIELRGVSRNGAFDLWIFRFCFVYLV